MLAPDVPDVRHRLAAELRRSRHAPARHDKFALAIGGDANDRSHLIREDCRQRRQVARAIVLHAEEVAYGRLAFGDATEVAHCPGRLPSYLLIEGGAMTIRGLGLAALLVSSIACAQEVHFSPEERLDAIDAALVATAKRSIDLASYALTDPIVLDALNDAERRGVVIRIVLDPRERHDFVKLGDLSDNVRIKRGGPFMHLKAYEIDGTLLRSGAANFSTSGENAQDNDLIVIRDPAAAAKFEAHFERMWEAAQPMIEFEPAIRALEPK